MCRFIGNSMCTFIKRIFELFINNGFQNVALCFYLVGLQCKFRGRSQENDLNSFIRLTKFSCGIHAIQKRHDNVQKDDIHAFLGIGSKQVISIIVRRDADRKLSFF